MEKKFLSSFGNFSMTLQTLVLKFFNRNFRLSEKIIPVHFISILLFYQRDTDILTDPHLQKH